MLTWFTKGKDVDLGLLPSMIDPADKRSAAEQFDANYQHGGGWRPQEGWVRIGDSGVIAYKDSDDPPLAPIAAAKMRGEIILVYPYSYVAIIQQSDGSFEVCRMD